MEQFKKDVKLGLSESPKRLPSKYFYDKKGDELFVQIMNMPEYYLTRAELEIFQTKAKEIVESFHIDKNAYFELIELGAGDGTKTIEILRELLSNSYNFSYLPVDISENALDGIEAMLKDKLPELVVKKQEGDYFGILSTLQKSNCPKVVLFLGSNLGNMPDSRAADFMSKLSKTLSPNDRILLGVDLIKSKEIVLPAYNDEAGITREFNLNLLRRMNAELGANFDVDQFEHAPEYEEQEGIAKSSLKSKREQNVYIEAIDETYRFKENEHIHTEISRKYNDEVLNEVLKGSNIEVQTKFTDSANLFADYVLIRK